MISILVLLTYFVMIIGGFLGVIMLFSWLMKRYTGYDIFKFRGAHHQYLNEEVDFAQRTDWDHEKGFVASKDNRKRQRRKSKATPHYDRLKALDSAKQRPGEPVMDDIDDTDDIVAIGELLEESQSVQKQ